MKKQPTRILHVIGKLGSGGIESFVINVYRHVIARNIQFDFIVFRDVQEFYEEEIRKLGGKKYALGKELSPKLLERIKRVFRFLKLLKEHPEYRIIHVHMSNPASALEYLLVSKLLGRKVIAHSHASGDYLNGKFRAAAYMVCRKIVCRFADKKLACSQKAAEWIFSSKYVRCVEIIYNGIDFGKFVFCQHERDKIRMQYHLGDNFIIGHVGRFAPEKNHRFLIEVFRKLADICNVELLLVGEGDGRKDVELLVSQSNLEGKVIFAGERRDVSCILQAMDVLVMPSKYEGFGIVAVEAQASGLPCVLSDSIPREVQCTDYVSFLSLNEGAEKWAEEIMKFRVKANRNASMNHVNSKEYDIRKTVEKIETVYMGL